MRVAAGGGIDGHGEAIEVLALPFKSAAAFVLDSAQPKSPGLMFGLLWAQQALESGAVEGRDLMKTGRLEVQGTFESGGPLELKSVLPS